MELVSLAGTALSLTAVCLPRHLTKVWLAALWLGHLSLYQVGQTFLWFQWDILLLEAGFLAIIAAPLFSTSNKNPLPSDHVRLCEADQRLSHLVGPDRHAHPLLLPVPANPTGLVRQPVARLDAEAECRLNVCDRDAAHFSLLRSDCVAAEIHLLHAGLPHAGHHADWQLQLFQLYLPRPLHLLG